MSATMPSNPTTAHRDHLVQSVLPAYAALGTLPASTA